MAHVQDFRLPVACFSATLYMREQMLLAFMKLQYSVTLGANTMCCQYMLGASTPVTTIAIALIFAGSYYEALLYRSYRGPTA